MKKRKYTRKVSPEAIQPKSKPIVEQVGNTTIIDLTGLTFMDLPLSLRKEIDSIIEHRKALDLFDDKKERIERALRYQEFINGRL